MRPEIHDPGVPAGVIRPVWNTFQTGRDEGYFPTLGSMDWKYVGEGVSSSSTNEVTPVTGQVELKILKTGGLCSASQCRQPEVVRPSFYHRSVGMDVQQSQT